MDSVVYSILFFNIFINFSVAHVIHRLAVGDSVCSEGCHEIRKGVTNVHIVPFSENEATLSYNNLIYALGKNLDRRFSLSETSFFWNWYSTQQPVLQYAVLDFIKNGQIQFVNGGWSRNVNAETSNYQEVIDQFSWGLRKLNDSLGSCGIPKILVHTENFKKSAPPLTFLSDVQYDGEILWKNEYTSSDRIEENGTRNGIIDVRWKENHLQGVMTDIFVSAASITQNNFLNHFQYIFLQHHSTKHILVPIPYFELEPEEKFTKIEELISGLQDDPNYNILYSSPFCYIKSLHQEQLERNHYDTEKSDWFSAFPNLKRHQRLENNFLQICKQLAATAHITNTSKIDRLREALGFVQRASLFGRATDEIKNVPRKLYEGYEECLDVVNDALRKLTDDRNTTYTNCMLIANTTECPFTLENDDFIVTVYNPLSRARTKMVRLPVKDTDKDYSVTAPDGSNRPYQLIPIPEKLLQIPERNDSAKYKLVFMAPNNPPLGFRSFYVKKTRRALPDGLGLDPVDQGNLFFETPKVNFSISRNTGLLETMNVGNIVLNITQNFFLYNTTADTPNTNKNLFSMFANDGQLKPTYRIYKGKIATEIHQVFNDWLSQVIRVYHTEDGVEFESIVGPIPPNFPRELDIVSRWSTDLKTKKLFYTDENGLNTVTRLSQPVNSKEALSANYYPVTAKIAIKDAERNIELMVLVDKATGGGSLDEGQVEIMLLRGADAKPNQMIQSLTYVIAGPIRTSHGELTVDARSIEMVNKKLLDAWNSVSLTKGLSFEDYRNTHNMEFQGMAQPLPRNAQVMTLEPWRESKYLLRLQHLFTEGADPVLSKPVTVDIKSLFSSFDIQSLQETDLAANKFISSELKAEENEFVKVLEPSEIRTFIVEVAQRTSGASLTKINLLSVLGTLFTMQIFIWFVI